MVRRKERLMLSKFLEAVDDNQHLRIGWSNKDDWSYVGIKQDVVKLIHPVDLRGSVIERVYVEKSPMGVAIILRSPRRD